jgi:hypothetical protein
MKAFKKQQVKIIFYVCPFLLVSIVFYLNKLRSLAYECFLLGERDSKHWQQLCDQCLLSKDAQ